VKTAVLCVIAFVGGFAFRSAIECVWWHQTSNAVGAGAVVVFCVGAVFMVHADL
jgi:hypothetical protein